MDIRRFDSDTQELIKKVKENNTGLQRGRQKLCRELIARAKKLNDEELLGYAYFYMGRCLYFMQNQLKKSMQNMKKALFYAQKGQDVELLARIYNMLGIDSSNRGMQELAIEYYMTGKNHALQSDNYEVHAILNYNIGYSYMEMDDLDGAIKCFMKAYRYSKKCSSKNQTALYVRFVICCVAGIIYVLNRNDNRMKKMYDEMEKLRHILGASVDDAIQEPLNYIFRINYFHRIGDTKHKKEVEVEFKKSLFFAPMPVDSIGDIVRYCEALVEHNHLKDAEDYIHLIETNVINTDIPHLNMDFYSMLAAFYDKKKDETGKQHAMTAYYENSQRQIQERKKAFTFYMEMMDTVEEIRLENIRLARQARTDVLTDISNRLDLMEVSESRFEKAKTDGVSIGIELFDIDKFKEYNDTYGHQVGDQCLVEIGRVLKTLSSDRVYVARYGGDEFYILYYNMTDDEIMETAKALRDRLQEIVVQTGKDDICGISVSQGIRNTVPTQHNKLWDYLYAADNAMYAVKQRNRGDIMIIHKAFMSDKSLDDAVTTD